MRRLALHQGGTGKVSCRSDIVVQERVSEVCLLEQVRKKGCERALTQSDSGQRG